MGDGFGLVLDIAARFAFVGSFIKLGALDFRDRCRPHHRVDNRGPLAVLIQLRVGDIQHVCKCDVDIDPLEHVRDQGNVQ